MRGRLVSTFAMAVLIAASAAPAMAAEPGVTTLSSWRPIASAGAIVGGTQTITIVNGGSATVTGLSVTLEPAPCECDRTAVVLNVGFVAGGRWVVPSLGAGEIASLTISYEAAGSVAETAESAPSTAAVSAVRALSGDDRVHVVDVGGRRHVAI